MLGTSSWIVSGLAVLIIGCSGCSGSVDSRSEGDAAVPPGDATSSPDSGAPELERWLLTVENNDDNEVHRLVRISVDQSTYGEKLEICADVTLPSEVPASNIISSLTFNEGRLYASGKVVDEGDSLFLIDPCTCKASLVGPYGFTSVPGITSTGEQDMFGLSSGQDVALTIDPNTGAGVELAELMGDWGTLGLTWSGRERDTLWAISGSADTIVELDHDTGEAIGAPIALDYDFGSVGTEYHPGLERLYACSTSGHLLEIDTTNGEVTVGPDLLQPGCNNLAAPFGSVECIPPVD